MVAIHYVEQSAIAEVRFREFVSGMCFAAAGKVVGTRGGCAPDLRLFNRNQVKLASKATMSSNPSKKGDLGRSLLALGLTLWAGVNLFRFMRDYPEILGTLEPARTLGLVLSGVFILVPFLMAAQLLRVQSAANSS